MTQANTALADVLAEERINSLLRQAKLVRDWPDGPDRAEEAKILIRAAFVEWALGRISQETESHIYSLLSFAMPADQVKRDNLQDAFQEQLDRQTCPECGDGICPVDDSQSPPGSQ